MASKGSFLFFATISFAIQDVSTKARSLPNGRKVLLVSMDGFRHDYFKKTNTPHFDAMLDSGATVPYVTPAFVPEAFPSHHSIATGLYAESHGIVGNKFYDPDLDKTFGHTSVEYNWWSKSEPFWINAVKSGLKVGTFFWPRTDVDFKGFRPLAFRSFAADIPYDVRIRTVVYEWLYLMDFDLCIMYFEEPDLTGHKYGPDDPHLAIEIGRMDATLGVLMKALETAGIKDKVDLIVTSDHGMAKIPKSNKVINLIHLLNLTRRTIVRVPSGASMVQFTPKPNKVTTLLDALSQVPHLNSFRKEVIPKRFHYSNNRRVADVVAFTDEGWLIQNKLFGQTKKDAGMHSYDNQLKSMRTIFVASGPSFKKGYRLQRSIESVDIYPLLCHILDLKPAPNNGSMERMKPLLNGFPDEALSRYTLSFIMISFHVIFVRMGLNHT